MRIRSLILLRMIEAHVAPLPNPVFVREMLNSHQKSDRPEASAPYLQALGK